jgi:hypothetical protein
VASLDALSRRSALCGILGTIPSLAACASARRAQMSTPFKCTTFIRRARTLAPAAFLPMWRERRAPMLQRLPGLTGLVFNLVDHVRSPETTYDAAVEHWFESEAAYAQAVNDAPAEITSALAANAADFMQPQVTTLFTREVSIRAQPPGRAASRAKRIGLVGRRPEMPQTQFFHDWVEEHAPPVDRQPGLERYVLNLLTRDRELDMPWDGYAELWWTDWDAYESGRAHIRERNDLNQRLGFFHAHELLLVEEHVALEPPRVSNA